MSNHAAVEYPHDIPKFECVGWNAQTGYRVFEYAPGIVETPENRVITRKVSELLGGKGGFKVPDLKKTDNSNIELITQLEVPHEIPDPIRRQIEDLLFASGFGEFDLSPDATAKLREGAVNALRDKVRQKLVTARIERGFNSDTDREERYNHISGGPYDTLFYRNNELAGARNSTGRNKSIYLGQRVKYVDNGVEKQGIIGKFILEKGPVPYNQLKVELESAEDHGPVGIFEVEKIMGPVVAAG